MKDRRKLHAGRWLGAFFAALSCLALWPAGASAMEPMDEAPIDRAYADFVVANTDFTVVHELVHVLIDEIGIPVVGREEDISDHLALMILLTQDVGGDANGDAGGTVSEEMHEMMQAVADAWRIEWAFSEESGMAIPWSDPHSLEIQRFYDIVCLTYGRDPETLAEMPIENELSVDRAELCPEDYDKAARGLRWIERFFGKGGAAAPQVDDPGTITVTYEDTDTLERQQLVRWMKEKSILPEVIARLHETYAFPRDVAIRFAACGQANAAWTPEKAAVDVCYGLMRSFVRLAEYRDEYAVTPREDALGMWKAQQWGKTP